MERNSELKKSPQDSLGLTSEDIQMITDQLRLDEDPEVAKYFDNCKPRK